jgi:hypothetical protein
MAQYTITTEQGTAVLYLVVGHLETMDIVLLESKYENNVLTMTTDVAMPEDQVEHLELTRIA